MDIKMGTIVGSKDAVIGNIPVSVGDVVEKDQVLLQYEIKKGSFSVKSPLSGIISKIYFSDGDTIHKDDILFDIEEAKEAVVAKSTNVTPVLMSAIVGAKEATVGTFAIKCGDDVHVGDELFQYETKKGNRPFKSTFDGQIVKILVDEGSRIERDTHLFDVKEVSIKEEVTVKETTNTKEHNTDIVIIGGGPGGYVSAIYAAKHGKKVILVEKESLGGTCLNVGCIPTKALVKSSEVCHSAKHSEQFGIEIDKSAIKVNMDEVINHKNSVVDRLVGGVEGLMNANKVTVLKGQASFNSKTEVSVLEGETEHIIKATDIIIATGSKISSVPIPGLNLPFVLNSTTALNLRELPESIAIVGGGVIGMEFAFLYNNLGVEVTVIEYMDRLLAMLDKEESDEIKRIALDQGIKVYTESKVLEVNCEVRDKAVVTFDNKGDKKLLVAEKVLVAIGRQPNMDGLNLDATGVVMDPKRRGIKVNGKMQTNVEHIYAIGDVTNIIQLAHVASHQGIVAVDNIIGHSKEMDYTAVPNVIFTSPEIASVGLSEKACIEQNIEYKIGRFDYSGNGKAITMEETEGYIKLIEDVKNNRLVGATIIGADASTLISSVTIAIQNKLTSEQIRETIFPHPTTTEVIHEAAMGLGIGTLHQ
jgi:dihydrolipoamide dehydrogenase